MAVFIDKNGILHISDLDDTNPFTGELELHEAENGLFGCNQKAKLYPDFSVKIKTANDYIFHPEPCKMSDADIQKRQAAVKFNREHGLRNDSKNFENYIRVMESLEDLVLLNDFQWFLTITLDQNKLDRHNVNVIIPKLNRWLKNMVQRKDLHYVLVPEYHKKGGIHLHALVSGNLNFVDSGTVTWPGQKKPVKPETAIKRGIPSSIWQKVYNVTDWKYGYSTAIQIYGDRQKFLCYVCKYIMPGQDKIFGKYFYSSQNLKRKPEILYGNVDFSQIDAEEFKINPDLPIAIKYQSNLVFSKE